MSNEFEDGSHRYGYMIIWDPCGYHPMRNYSQICSAEGRTRATNFSEHQEYARQLLRASWDDIENHSNPASRFEFLAVLLSV